MISSEVVSWEEFYREFAYKNVLQGIIAK